MKFVSSLCIIMIASSFLTVSAFGVGTHPKVTVSTLKAPPATTFTKASTSPLFRDVTKIRGGAVPGWAAYNEALDKKPLITKAMTSLVGWALGDLLAQVRRNMGTTFVFLKNCRLIYVSF